MTLRSSDLQSDSDLNSIRNSCDVLYRYIYHTCNIFHVWTFCRSCQSKLAALSDRRFEGSSNGFLSGENVWLDSKPLSSENFHLIFRISIEQLFLHRFLYLNSLNTSLKSQTNKQARLVGESFMKQWAPPTHPSPTDMRTKRGGA